LGCGGIRVEDPARLNEAISEALDSGVPFVVDVRTSLAESFQRVTAPLAMATYQENRLSIDRHGSIASRRSATRRR
jgi:thiamine pyrophosphate-dependent acetolactate synthase large subunit-like protein